MAPKKKGEAEVEIKPEDLLPEAFKPLPCVVFWVEPSLPPAENGDVVKCGLQGSLVLVHELVQNRIEYVDVEFEGLQEAQKVLFSGVSLEPPTLDMLKELSTGLLLPMRGVDVAELWEIRDIAKQAEAIGTWLHLESQLEDQAQQEIVRDFHFFNIEHAKALSLTALQATVFHAIMAKTLSIMRSPSAKNDASRLPLPDQMISAGECFQAFQRLILAHSANEPPARLAIFSPSEARLLVDFAQGTLFKHFLLYQCCINGGHQVETLHFVDAIDCLPGPPDLMAGKIQSNRPRGSKNAAPKDSDASRR
jgi:hypothetical protein